MPSPVEDSAEAVAGAPPVLFSLGITAGQTPDIGAPKSTALCELGQDQSRGDARLGVPQSLSLGLQKQLE